MTIERIKEAVALEKRILTFNEEGIFGWDGNRPGLQCRHEAFMEAFPDAKVTYDGERDYPYRASTTMDGVELFCLMSEEEFNELARS